MSLVISLIFALEAQCHVIIIIMCHAECVCIQMCVIRDMDKLEHDCLPGQFAFHPGFSTFLYYAALLADS